MDAKATEVASQPLKYQIWFLKVSIHCEGCRRKVNKVLRNIDGVFTTTIDPQQQKVTVTGNVGVETLIRKLVKAGKHAEVWPENLPGERKTSGKAKKRNGRRDPESLESHSAEKTESNNRGIESAANCKSESKSSSKSPENSPAGEQAPPEEHKGGQSSGGGSGKKKKKKKSHSGGNGSNGLNSASANTPSHAGFQFQVPGQEMGPVNLIPTRQQSYPYPYPETGYPPLVYVATYNRLYPMGRMGGPSSYYVPPSPYKYAGLDQESYQLQSTPLVSFEIFSDENANGCSIM